MAVGNLRYTPQYILSIIERVEELTNAEQPQTSLDPDHVLATMLSAEMELQGIMPWSSNYTFLADLVGENQTRLLAIYKPGQGERRLWDFPDRTLWLREFASYLVSLVLNWPNIPPTVLRDGPHGPGSVQLFIDAEYDAHYFNMRNISAFRKDFRQMALFDFIVNNADRKGGHCLKDKRGRIWAIDHGLTFHVEPKLRTVIWEFCEDAIPDSLLADLTHLHDLLRHESRLFKILADLISPREIEAFRKRTGLLVSTGNFPAAGMGRNVPFPPI